MKKFSTAILILALSTVFQNLAVAQWDYSQHAIDNIIESRIDARKTRARIRARQGKSQSSKSVRKTSKSTARKAAVRKVSVAPKKVSLPSHVEFYRDTFQDFHLSDSKGYIVNFIFTSTAGKVLCRTHNFTYYNSVARFEDIPVGKYKVVAQGLCGGKKYPIHLASEDGEVDNPTGGNFAPSIVIEVKLGKDPYGSPRLLTLPETLHVRVIE